MEEKLLELLTRAEAELDVIEEKIAELKTDTVANASSLIKLCDIRDYLKIEIHNINFALSREEKYESFIDTLRNLT